MAVLGVARHSFGSHSAIATYIVGNIQLHGMNTMNNLNDKCAYILIIGQNIAKFDWITNACNGLGAERISSYFLTEPNERAHQNEPVFPSLNESSL